jgi:hypothetical protein
VLLNRGNGVDLWVLVVTSYGVRYGAAEGYGEDDREIREGSPNGDTRQEHTTRRRSGQNG